MVGLCYHLHLHAGIRQRVFVLTPGDASDGATCRMGGLKEGGREERFGECFVAVKFWTRVSERIYCFGFGSFFLGLGIFPMDTRDSIHPYMTD
jgi:hypothetical protein